MQVEFRAPEPVPVEEPASNTPAPASGAEGAPQNRKTSPAKPVEIQVRDVKVEPSRTASLSRAEVHQIPGTFGDPFRAILSTFGLAHQPPAFVVPLPGFQPGGLRGGLQLAVQESGGIEYNFGEATTGTATLFHNGFFNTSDALGATQMTVGGCPPGSFPGDTLGGDLGGQPTGARDCTARFDTGKVGRDGCGGGDSSTVEALETRTNGEAYGLELFLKRRLASRVGGFLSYTLSRSIRTYQNQTFVATCDRTHVLNAAIAFDLGRNWRAGTRASFYTGLPKAPDPTDPDSSRLPPFSSWICGWRSAGS